MSEASILHQQFAGTRREEMIPQLLRSTEAAAYLSISPRTLWTLTKRGDIPCVRIGRSVRYDRRDLEAWIQRAKESGTPPHAPSMGKASPPERVP